MRRKKILKHQRKIKHRDVGVKYAYREMTDEEVAVATGISTDEEDRYCLKEEDMDVEKKVEEEETTCPECGGPLIQAIESGGSMSVGKTYAQTHMPPFTVSEEVVCSKCGLVIRKSVRQVHR